MGDLEDTQYFYEYSLPDFFPPDDGNSFSVNESVSEEGDNSDNDSYHIVHVEIQEYQIQNMNVNQIKDKIKKRKKNYVWCKNISNEKTFNSFEEKAPLYVDGSGLTKNQQNKKENTPMIAFPKTAYWNILVPNAESVDKTTNPYLKILATHLLWKMKQILFWYK